MPRELQLLGSTWDQDKLGAQLSRAPGVPGTLVSKDPDPAGSPPGPCPGYAFVSHDKKVTGRVKQREKRERERERVR